MTLLSVESAVNLADLEVLGRANLDRNALEYYASGANDEHTLRTNRSDFARLRLRPRVLVDVSSVTTSTTVLGFPLSSPVGIAPSAFHGLAHRDAERATARAAAAQGSLMTLSTFSNTPMHEVAREAQGRWWFQLYCSRDRALSKTLVERADAAGARALVVTADAPFLGRREANERHAFRLPEHLSVPNVGMLDPTGPSGNVAGSQLARHFQDQIDPTFSWRDLEWLRSLTSLPIVLKGVLTAEDALLAAEHGVHVWVSNHGGRQLDTAVSSIEALPEIVDAVAGRVEVYLDGGVTRGTDVIKALALGARAVFLGRAALWGLAAGGESGVRRTLALLQEEVRLAMALCGVPSVDRLTPALIRRGD